MGDLGGGYPIQIQTEETKAMKLKWIKIRKQEAKSKIMHAKQAIEDLIEGKKVELEREILHAEQLLEKLTVAEHELEVN